MNSSGNHKQNNCMQNPNIKDSSSVCNLFLRCELQLQICKRSKWKFPLKNIIKCFISDAWSCILIITTYIYLVHAYNNQCQCLWISIWWPHITTGLTLNIIYCRGLFFPGIVHPPTCPHICKILEIQHFGLCCMGVICNLLQLSRVLLLPHRLWQLCHQKACICWDIPWQLSCSSHQ